MTYDLHAHCVPTELLDVLRVEGSSLGIEIADEPGGIVTVFNGRRIGPLEPELMDVQGRLAAMDAMGIDVQLLSHKTDLSGYLLGADAGSRYSRLFNRVLADMVAESAGRFLALGTVPLQSPDAAADELGYAVEDLGMVGVEIASTVNGNSLDQAALDPFWEVANDLRCLILLHPLDPLPGVDLSRYFMANMVGRPAESTVAIGNLIFSGVLDRYPDLVICLVHGGGFLPYQLGRFEKGYGVKPEVAGQHIGSPPGVYARRLYFDSLLHSPLALRFLIDQVGVDRVVIGTDYPYEMHERNPVERLDAVPGLTGAERAAVLEGNIERLVHGVRRGARRGVRT